MLIQSKAMTYPSSIGGGGSHAVGGGDYSIFNNNNNNTVNSSNNNNYHHQHHHHHYNHRQQPTDIMTYSSYVNGSIFSIPKCWSEESTDQVLLTVYSFIKTFVGGSGAGQGTIDNRIEQAMDLVKSHLMSAVRSEVEELRDKISKLEDTVSLLSRENELLRASCNPEVLANLRGAPGGGGGSAVGHLLPPPDLPPPPPHSQPY